MTADAPTWEAFVGAWELFRAPMLCALSAGAVLGFLGVYVVLRRMVFVSAAVTQAAALGVALAFYADIHLGTHVEPVAGAALLSLLCTGALLIEPERVNMTRESVLGLVFATTGGAAVFVGDRIAQEAHDIQSILFGTAVLVRPFDLTVILVVAAVVLGFHLWWYRGLVFASFDEVAARVQGLPVRLLQGTVLVSIGLTVGVTARALGALPVFALATLPPMAALVGGAGLNAAFALAAAGGAVAGFVGYALAFFCSAPVGAMQTLAAAALVPVALVVRGTRRWIAAAGRGSIAS